MKQVLGAGLAACAIMAATSAMAADMALPAVAPIAVYDWGTKTVAINGAVTPGGPAIPASFGVQNQQKINEVKAGLNWRFAPDLW